MATARTARVRTSKAAAPTEGALFKGLFKKLDDLVTAHNKNADGLEATDERVAAIETEVEELKKRPTLTPAEIDSLLGSLDKMVIK